jgi:hypothetical protein
VGDRQHWIPRQERVVPCGGGPDPPTGAASSRPLLVLGTQEAGVRRLLQAIEGVDGDETPWVKCGCLGPRQNGDLDTAGALGVQPGTFGNACSALVSTVQSTAAECKHRLLGPAAQVESVEDRRSPLPSVCDRQAHRNVTQITICDAEAQHRRVCDDRGNQHSSNPDCHISPHHGSHEEAEAPVESKSQARAARSAARGSSGITEPDAPGFLDVPVQVLERIGRARVAQMQAEAELAALVDHAVELGVGWPEIAAQLGVTRQAARQHYQRRHHSGASRQDRMA